MVVYESMYGNTHRSPTPSEPGSRPPSHVRVVPVSQASPEVIADADLVVVGGPTHAHGISRATTRKAAVRAADKPVGGLTVEPDALGPGLRDWFGLLGDCPVRAAAFEHQDARARRADRPGASTGVAPPAPRARLRRGRRGPGRASW